MNGGGGAKRVMIAKFDYDSRQLSPNVDAEQVKEKINSILNYPLIPFFFI